MKNQILNLGKDSFVYGIGSILVRSSSIITLPLFTSILSKEEYGVLAMIGILGMVIQPVFGLGVSASLGISYFKKNDLKTKSESIWGAFILNLISVSILFFIALSFPNAITSLIRLNEDSIDIVFLSIISVSFVIMTDPFIQRVQFEKKAKLFVLITTLTTFLSILFSIYAVAKIGLGIKGIIYGQILGSILNFILFASLSVCKTLLKTNLTVIKEMFFNGIPLVPSFGFAFFLIHGNKYLLEYYHGLSSVGIYTVGFNLGVTISIITGGISKAWYPFFLSYTNKQDELRNIFGQIVYYYLILVGVLCSGYFLFSKSIVSILADENFLESYLVVGFAATTYASQTLFSLFLPNLYFSEKVKIVSYIYLISVIISIPIVIILIEKYSILGCSIGLLISNVIPVLLLYSYNKYSFTKPFVIGAYSICVLKIIVTFGILIISFYSLPSYSILINIIIAIVFFTFALIFSYASLNKNEKYQIKVIFTKYKSCHESNI